MSQLHDDIPQNLSSLSSTDRETDVIEYAHLTVKAVAEGKHDPVPVFIAVKMADALLASADRERKYREALEEILALGTRVEDGEVRIALNTANHFKCRLIARSALPTEQEGWLRTGNEARPVTRNDVLEEAAKVAETSCLVPPDGGEPTPDEQAVSENAARLIRALKREGDAP